MHSQSRVPLRWSTIMPVCVALITTGGLFTYRRIRNGGSLVDVAWFFGFTFCILGILAVVLVWASSIRQQRISTIWDAMSDRRKSYPTAIWLVWPESQRALERLGWRQCAPIIWGSAPVVGLVVNGDLVEIWERGSDQPTFVVPRGNVRNVSTARVYSPAHVRPGILLNIELHGFSARLKMDLRDVRLRQLENVKLAEIVGALGGSRAIV